MLAACFETGAASNLQIARILSNCNVRHQHAVSTQVNKMWKQNITTATTAAITTTTISTTTITTVPNRQYYTAYDTLNHT